MGKEKTREILRFIKFALFSASAGIIEILVFTLLNELTPWGYWACYLPALVLSVVWNFTLNRRYAFRAEGSYARQMLMAFLFYLVFTPVTTVGGNFLAENLGVNNYIVLIGTMALNFITEYLYQRFYVFRATIDTNNVAERAGELQLSEAERKALKAQEAEQEASAE